MLALWFLSSLLRTELVTDLGTNGRVSVRFSAPSPWISGTKAFVQISSQQDKHTPDVTCATSVFYQDNLPTDKGVTIILNGSPDHLSTVGELIAAFEESTDREDFPVPELLFGDPNTLIGANYETPQRIYFSPERSVSLFFGSKVWIPRF